MYRALYRIWSHQRFAGVVGRTAIVTALLRIIMREKSPWKVRSVLFDAIIGIGLGLGLLLLYFAPSLFWIR